MVQHPSIRNLQIVLDNITAAAGKTGDTDKVKLVAVSKTFMPEDIKPVLEAGHRLFGENRVQEAQSKWPALRSQYENVKLHLIGPLQTNKVANAVSLFDCIETLDREKLARAIARESEKQGRKPALFIQVNTGAEPQKAGILKQDLASFVDYCRDDLNLMIDGLMCIPPVNEDAQDHFRLLADLAKKHDLSELSMGMSSDYELAIACGATFVRVGSAIFGGR